MTKKILPVTYPTITTYPPYADVLAILMSHNESLNWVYSHYIQTYVIEILDGIKENLQPTMSCVFGDFDNRRIANSIADNVFFNREVNPFFNVFEIPNSLVEKIGETYISLIKKAVDLSMYVYAYCDVSKIKAYNRVEGLSHEILIYGYDEYEKTIYYADFPNNNSCKYNFSKCSYEEIENALLAVENLFLPIVKSMALIQFESKGPFVFDMNYVKESIADYLYPNKEQLRRFGMYVDSFVNNGDFKWTTKVYMGIETYDYYANVYDHIIEGIIDFRLYHAMYEHKKMMLKRIKHFVDNGVIHFDEEKKLAFEKYEGVARDLLKVRNRIIKYNISKKKSDIDCIPSEIDRIRKLEKSLLKVIFEI